jgi:hypothetical protein
MTGFWLLSIPDPGSNNNNKRGGGTKFVVLPCFATSNDKFYKIENYFFICTGKEKDLRQFTKNYRTFYLKKGH